MPPRYGAVASQLFGFDSRRLHQTFTRRRGAPPESFRLARAAEGSTFKLAETLASYSPLLLGAGLWGVSRDDEPQRRSNVDVSRWRVGRRNQRSRDGR